MKIISLNTWKCDGDYSSRIENTLAFLKGQNPDLICLQEAFKTADGSTDTAQTIADFLGYSLFYSPARQKERLFKGEYKASWSGLAILSKYKLEDCITRPLWDLPEGGERIFQAVNLNKNGKSWLVINTHLCHLISEDSVRQKQLNEILAYCESQNAGTNTIICGDMNAELDVLNEACNNTTYQLKDSFDIAYPGRDKPATVLGLNKSIDFIFMLITKGKVTLNVVESTVHNGANLDYEISDHHPISATILT